MRFNSKGDKPTLTQKEKAVYLRLCTGESYKEIAAAFDVSLNTTRTHIKRIYSKLGVRSRTAAVVAGLRRSGTPTELLASIKPQEKR